ncbi:MAG: hypothetical protein ACQCN4_10370 [Candidatus Bathyarchaeia archaeon]
MSLPPNIDLIKSKIETEFKAYTDSIEVLGALREFLDKNAITSYIEKKVYKINGGDKQPDLLVVSKNFLFIDHKFTKSNEPKTLEDKIEEMAEYNRSFYFDDPKSRKRIQITPECVMLTPKEVIKHFRKNAKCPITWGYKIDGTVFIEESIGKVNDSKIASFFKPSLIIPISRERRKYRFVLSHAPKCYTAFQVYNAICFIYNSKDCDKTTFQANYNDLLSDFNDLFPPWVLKEAKQLNATRLDEALSLLTRLGWIEVVNSQSGKVIIVNRKKFLRTGDVLGLFKAEEAKELFEQKMREYKVQEKKGYPSQKTTQLTLNLFPH